MDVTVLVSGLVALVGVWSGGFLSSRAQNRAWRREQARLWRDTRRAAYGRLVAAVRQYRTYVTAPDARVEVSWRPDGSRLIPVVGGACQEAMEAAFTETQLVATDQETVDRAHFLTSVARRVATARAVYGVGQVPVDLDEALFAAERDFLNCARRDLGLTDVDASPLGTELAGMDARIVAAYGDGQ